MLKLYLTRKTTAAMIQEGAALGLLRAYKYYPPHGIINSEYGVPMNDLIGGDFPSAMEEHRITPQHLLFALGHLILDLKHHLYLLAQ